MSQVELPATITVDDKVYQIETLSDQIKEMIALHQVFTNDVRESRIKLAKDEIAREALGVKIANQIKINDPEIANNDSAGGENPA